MDTTEETPIQTSPEAPPLPEWTSFAPPESKPARWQPEDQQARPLLRMLEGLGSRDPGLRKHCEAVGDLAAKVALRLGFADNVVGRLRLAGILHDIGKIAVPTAILQKPGPLDAQEWDRVRQHPQTGFTLIRGYGLNQTADWVLAHHERPDGRGYPFGLRSEEIPLQSAVLSAADAFHAMVAERPYQPSLSPVEAREELRRCAGSQFEPAVVQALCEVTKVRRFQRRASLSNELAHD